MDFEGLDKEASMSGGGGGGVREALEGKGMRRGRRQPLAIPPYLRYLCIKPQDTCQPLCSVLQLQNYVSLNSVFYLVCHNEVT